ncbi:phage tail protein [Leptospira sp. 96542]|nr:phage tail protein [Leptospira sp. 96542]
MPIHASRAARRVPGTLDYWPGNTPPPGALRCNGAAVSRTVYARLFAVIGTTFGAGDGVTTFNLPDERGEFRRAWDDGRGVDTGRALGSWQNHALEAHTHVAARQVAGGSGYPGFSGSGDAATAGNVSATGGAETRPRNLAYLAIIWY